MRFIPACAGNSCLDRASHSEKAVHPRVCGEQRDAAVVARDPAGSSPRVRGTECPTNYSAVVQRFIPACAGNSPFQPNTPILWPVHPRVCGEQSAAQARDATNVGSSPRVRGTARFIAGLTRHWTVHPRVCGEQSCADDYERKHYGSSPRVRGTGRSALGSKIISRFIPACAGNRPYPAARSNPQSVHPRVCGEQTRSSIAIKASFGSSPRVRGTVPRQYHHSDSSRFIPACAGNRCRVTGSL